MPCGPFRCGDPPPSNHPHDRAGRAWRPRRAACSAPPERTYRALVARTSASWHTSRHAARGVPKSGLDFQADEIVQTPATKTFQIKRDEAKAQLAKLSA